MMNVLIRIGSEKEICAWIVKPQTDPHWFADERIATQRCRPKLSGWYYKDTITNLVDSL